MAQAKENELMDNREKKVLSFSVSELLLAYGNLKRDDKPLGLIDSHASLFHAIRSFVKSNKKTAGHDKVLVLKELHHPSFVSSEKQDVIKEDLASPKDTLKDKDTSVHVHPKHLFMPKRKSVGFGMEQNGDHEELPPAHLLPYLVLIKNYISLPVSTIQKLCLSGEILYKMEYFTLRHEKEKAALPEPAELPVPMLPLVKEVKYATFDSLKDLQWKLFKGLLKRKPKTIRKWRVPKYSFGIKDVSAHRGAEYILPLIPQDWIIDDSLKFSEKMRHLLLGEESNS